MLIDMIQVCFHITTSVQFIYSGILISSIWIIRVSITICIIITQHKFKLVRRLEAWFGKKNSHIPHFICTFVNDPFYHSRLKIYHSISKIEKYVNIVFIPFYDVLKSNIQFVLNITGNIRKSFRNWSQAMASTCDHCRIFGLSTICRMILEPYLCKVRHRCSLSMEIYCKQMRFLIWINLAYIVVFKLYGYSL